jgi:D-glycerate 3-kinase
MEHQTRSLEQILNDWADGQKPTLSEWQQLAAEEFAAPQRAKAFGLTADNAQERIQARSHLFQAVCADVLSLPAFRSPETDRSRILLSLWNLWLPLASQLASRQQQLGHPLIQGILGGQGTGKTTMAAVLSVILAQMGDRTLSLSLDDLYKTYEERQCLQQQDPRLIWRGPPGTHDVELGVQILDQLRQSDRTEPVDIPRFDKSARGGAGDRTAPEPIDKVDIVLFEGWFVGVRPIDPETFDASTPDPIQTAADCAFARDTNQRLSEYLPLWNRLDRLIVLNPVDYHLSLEWRTQAERQMIATGRSGMTNSQVEEFVKYFWKALHPELFITPLTRDPDWVDLVIEINRDRTIRGIYQPSHD